MHAMPMRAASAVASRSATVLVQDPPSQVRARSTSDRTDRPRASTRSQMRAMSMRAADSMAMSAPTDSANSMCSSTASGGVRGDRRSWSSPRAMRHARSPSFPRRSSTDACGRAATWPTCRSPSDASNWCARASSGSRDAGRGERNSITSSAVTTTPARAAWSDENGVGPAPARPSHPTGSAAWQRRISADRPPCRRSNPSASNAHAPSSWGSTAAPRPSRRSVTRSAAMRTESGSGTTRSRSGHRASASPTANPGRTP